MGRYWQGLQITIGFVSNCFQSQTDVAAFEIGFNIFSKARPIVFPTDELSGFVDTKVPCQWIIVVPTNELCSNDFGYER